MSSGFITETEIAEARQKRQEEWERVRSADQPLEAPEEVYDSRSLFERLQEQKQKKDLEYEEAHKLKNMIKGLDDDEIEFLDLVDRTKLAAERKKTLEEERELNEYRNRVASLQEKSLDQRLHAEKTIASKPKPIIASVRQSQMKLLKGAVVTKLEPKKRKLSESDCEHSDKGSEVNCKYKTVVNDQKSLNVSSNLTLGKRKLIVQKALDLNNGHDEGALKCIGILPGMGCYNDSSESDASSDVESGTEGEKIDILGRKIKKPEKEQ